MTNIAKSNDLSLNLKLNQGARVAVIGGGPAGSFFSYFIQVMSRRANLEIQVDIYEPRDFETSGPSGCNMCGGVLYESLVQSLAVEGINLPNHVVQRGIEYNMLHMPIGNVMIRAPRQEKRIATTYRGTGPRGLHAVKRHGLDGYLMAAALAMGARHIRGRVDHVRWQVDPEPPTPEARLVQVKTQGGEYQSYELLAVTSGVNTAVLKLFSGLNIGYQPPRTSKLLVREYHLGEQVVSKYLGPVFHAFLLEIPGLDYGAIIPKGEYITICLLSSHGDLQPEIMDMFLNDPAVKMALPPDFSPDRFACNCSPRINTVGSIHPFGNRIVFIGDCGVSRLYKDGIGAAYRTAKIAAKTAIFQGISEEDFKKHYLPFLKKMELDNKIGILLFKVVSQIQKQRFVERAVLEMVTNEQHRKVIPEQSMSTLIWDMLTGGAPYREVLLLALHPLVWMRFLMNVFISLVPRPLKRSRPGFPSPTRSEDGPNPPMDGGKSTNMSDLGRLYQSGEVIISQGEIGDCMYVIQDGSVEVLIDVDGQEVQLAVLGQNDFFGEMAIFENEVRMATVRAIGFARILTIDKKNLLRRIHEDPSLAYRLIEVMSGRIRNLGIEISQLKHVQI